MSERVTQAKCIRHHLEEYGMITPKIAWEMYGCYRLSARIKELRSVMDIKTMRVPYINGEGHKKLYTEYRMVEQGVR